MKRIKVLLAEDHMVVREGFRKMLELESDIEIVGEAQDGRRPWPWPGSYVPKLC
jgi:DNA-binding NarL/FixJ family response regulator